MAFSAQGPQRPGFHRAQADINVTPLVDIMLVLLVIFMVTAPLLAAGMKVDLPQAKAAQPLNPKQPIVVIVGKDGKLVLGADPVESADLVASIRAKMGDDSNRVVHLRGDREAAYGQVVAVMDALATYGITHIAMDTDAGQTTPATKPNGAPEPGK
jgi:biopolymer transport protein ExbD/biopolymer transport protein TolR